MNSRIYKTAKSRKTEKTFKLMGKKNEGTFITFKIFKTEIFYYYAPQIVISN